MAEAGKLFHLLNVVGSVEHSVSVETIPCHCSRKTPVQYVDGGSIVYDKVLFTNVRQVLLILIHSINSMISVFGYFSF